MDSTPTISPLSTRMSARCPDTRCAPLINRFIAPCTVRKPGYGALTCEFVLYRARTRRTAGELRFRRMGGRCWGGVPAGVPGARLGPWLAGLAVARCGGDDCGAAGAWSG